MVKIECKINLVSLVGLVNWLMWETHSCPDYLNSESVSVRYTVSHRWSNCWYLGSTIWSDAKTFIVRWKNWL